MRSRPGGVAELVFDRSEKLDRYFVEADGTVIDPDASRPVGAAERIGHVLASLGLIIILVVALLVFVGPALPSYLPHIGNPLPTWLARIAVAGCAFLLLGLTVLLFGAPHEEGFRRREFTRLD